MNYNVWHIPKKTVKCQWKGQSVLWMLWASFYIHRYTVQMYGKIVLSLNIWLIQGHKKIQFKHLLNWFLNINTKSYHECNNLTLSLHMHMNRINHFHFIMMYSQQNFSSTKSFKKNNYFVFTLVTRLANSIYTNTQWWPK